MRLQHRCFPVIIAKFLRTLFKDHLWWLLLYFKAFILHMTTYKVYYIIVESYALFLQEEPEFMIIFLKKLASYKIFFQVRWVNLEKFRSFTQKSSSNSQ